jgi:hypothetical protein
VYNIEAYKKMLKQKTMMKRLHFPVAEFNYKKAFYYSRRDVFVLSFTDGHILSNTKFRTLKFAAQMVSSKVLRMPF